MRARVVGLPLVGLGGFAVAVACLVRIWPASAPQELSLDESWTSVAVGEATYLEPARLIPRTGAAVSTSVRVRGDADSGDADGNTVVWAADVTVSDADGTLVSTSTTVACLDRRSAEAVGCAGESVDGAPVDLAGLVLAFPPDTAQRDYDLWNGTVRQSLPARFAGTEEFRGLEVYRFEEQVPEQVVGTETVPAVFFGPDEEGTLPASLVHSGTRTMLVEPVSGIVVSSEESPLTVFRAADGRPGPVLLSGTFRATDESVADAVDRAREVLDRRSLTGSVLPWTLGCTGVALVALGVLIVARGRSAAAPPVEDEPVRVPVPAA